jgi:HEPN domain-containing protein
MREEARNWLLQSDAELHAAEGAVGYGSHYLAAFCAHQAIEKALKGHYIERMRDAPPRTHNLLDLASFLSPPEAVKALLRRLNPHYSVARYPDAANGVPAQLYDETTARELVTAAKDIVRWLASV